MLARGTRSKVRACNQHTSLDVGRLVEDEFRVLPPLIKQRIVIPCLRDALEEISRNDLVGIDIGATKGNAHSLDHRNLVH
ncbi:unannotated protein [freshwater metagenome]|uniref:Unannotated protein n=1 Tax=freshwater metagenome TaxID=449393 RepID=A0A6J6E3Q1_9ZZZZ